MLGNVPKMGKPVDWTYSTATSEGTADCHCSAEDSNSCDRGGIIATAAPNATIFIVSFFLNKKTFLNACSLHYHTLGRQRKERRVRWYRCLERVKVWWLPLKRRKLVVSSALNYLKENHSRSGLLHEVGPNLDLDQPHILFVLTVLCNL